MEFILVTLLNGVSYGLILFMLSAGFTLIFSMMGVLNFAHASFYMMGAYLAYEISSRVGFWPALISAPLLAGVLGAAVERFGLRSVHRFGHVAELLLTFGLSYITVEAVQLVWGRGAVPYLVPDALQGALFKVYNTTFPTYRAFMMLVAVLMLVALLLVLRKTHVGLIIQAALSHPEMLESLGHNVPRVFMVAFAGGCALAGLAGAIGGNAFITEPNMAATVGSIIFVVVVVGGLGSLLGALLASLLIGVVQTFAVSVDHSLATLLAALGYGVTATTPGHAVLQISVSEVAPVLPYVLLVLMLVIRPRGLLGRRET